jgi:GNAT superfamily N-acetyltransferase
VVARPPGFARDSPDPLVTTTPPATNSAHAVKVTPAFREKAAERLVAKDSPLGDATRRHAKAFLAAAHAHAIDLNALWASVDPADPTHTCREVVLVVPGTGKTGMCFTSHPNGPTAEGEVAMLLERACAELPSVTLAQALLEPTETAAHRIFLNAGFTEVGRLAYLRRPTPKRGEYSTTTSWPEGITVTNWKRGEDGDLALALERSYIDTLDCPGLCGLRDTQDVIASHRGTGVFDPSYWWIIRKDHTPQGAMLFNPCPDQSSIELVYVGLAPAVRGIGLGRTLMHTALAALSGRRERSITCAVDTRNTPAMRLYNALQFESFAERIALVRPVRANRG